MARTIPAAAVALPLLLAAGSVAWAQAEPPGLFVLPVKTDRWGGSALEPGAARLLEARVVTALARGGRVHAQGPRDVPADARAGLPRDLTTCIAPACLKALGRATRTERVLAVELLAEEQHPILFATLYDAASGEIVDRRELPWPSTAPATRAWAGEVARWASGAPATPPPPPPPSLTVELGAQQAGRPEAQALRLALIAHLQERGWPPLAAPLGMGRGPGTHRALITIENVAVSERIHHVHRYRRGVLVARVDVVNARGAVLWSARQAADLTARSEHTGNPQMVDALVADVAARLALDLQDPVLERAIARPDNKGEP